MADIKLLLCWVLFVNSKEKTEDFPKSINYATSVLRGSFHLEQL